MGYDFNGSSQILRIENAIVTAYPYTFSIIVNLDNVSALCFFCAQCASNANDPYTYLGVNSSGQFVAGLSSTVIGVAATSAAIYSTGTTYHVAGKYESSAITLYVNGLNVASSSNTISFPSGYNRFSIGALDRPTPVVFTDGRLAEMAIWNVALTDDEILGSARGFTPDQIRPQSLQLYAPLVRNLIDVRGGRVITNVNGATVATHPRIIT